MEPSCHCHRKWFASFFRARSASSLPPPSRGFRFPRALPRTFKTTQRFPPGDLRLTLTCLPVLPLASFSLRSSPRPISTNNLHTLLHFQRWPISSSSLRGLTSLRNGNLLLEGGFTLRCLQRLSRPYFASLLCPWQDNSCTSGTSIPVLSY